MTDLPDFNVNPDEYGDTIAKQEFQYELAQRLKDSSGTVVEIGSSNLPVSSVLGGREGINVIGIDKDARPIDNGQYQLINADMTQARLRDVVPNEKQNDVSGVVMSDILGYLPNWREAISDGYDLLKGGGELVIYHRVGRGWLEELSDEAPKNPAEIFASLDELGGQIEVHVFNETTGRFELTESPKEEDAPHMFVVTKK